jgi:hypothetical protein
MPYGEIKVDNITFTNVGADQATTVSGIYRAITSGVTVTGTISGATIQGATISGTAGIFGAGSVAAPSISFTSDPNTGIYSPAADTLAFVEGGVEVLRIDSSGRVGIGTSSPAYPLHVVVTPFSAGSQGAIRIGESSNTATFGTDVGFGFEVGTGIPFSYLATGSNGNSTLRINVAGTERLRIDASGRVGIGTTIPANRSTTQVTSDNDGIRVQFSGTPIGGQGPRLIFGHNTNNGTQQIFAAIKSLMQGGNDVTWSSDLAFYTGGSSLAERLRIDFSGNVGIGTSAPTSLLHVNQPGITGGEYGVRVSQQSATANALRLTVNSTNGLSGLMQESTIPLVFGTNNTERARIDSSGRLLVGTSSARTSALHTGSIQLEGTTFSTSTLSIIADANDASGSYIHLGKARGGSIGSTTIVASGDTLGQIHFTGADGTNLINGAFIAAQVDGTPGANDMPGRLVFSTTADGAASPTERFRIGSAGQLGIGGATYGTTGQVLTSGGASAAPTWGSSVVSGTSVASTSGTSIDFTGIPSWAKRITVMFNGVSTNGTSVIQVQLGAGSIATTGYTSTANSSSGGGTVVTSSTTGLVVSGNNTTGFFTHGAVVISNFGANAWVALGNTIPSTAQTGYMAGSATLSGTVDRVRITTVNGTDTFDSGSINILYE